MDKINNLFKSNFGKYTYKVLNDILVLLLVSYALLLVAEGLMPGLLSSHLSLTRLTIAVFAVLGSVIYLGKLNNIQFTSSSKKTVIFYGLIILAILLTVNSMLKFSWWENIIITIVSLFLLLYFKKEFLKA